MNFLSPQLIQQLIGIVLSKAADTVSEKDEYGDRKLSKKQAAKSVKKTSLLSVLMIAAFQYGANTGVISQQTANCAPQALEEIAGAVKEEVHDYQKERALETKP